MEVTPKKETLDFMFYAYFGINSEDTKESIALKCAKRAYRDFNRTLEFNTNDMKERETFCTEMSEFIATKIVQSIFVATRDDFDEKHQDLCKKIRDKAIDSRKLTEKEVATRDMSMGISRQCFYYGQAQKWLNMTIKYMWLVGLWDKDLEPLKASLHVPVDNYVLKAIWHEGLSENKKGQQMDKRSVESFEVKLPCYDNNKRKNKYNPDKILAWSKWDEDTYKIFQESLREYVKEHTQFETVFDWEQVEWIKVAAKQRKETQEG